MRSMRFVGMTFLCLIFAQPARAGVPMDALNRDLWQTMQARRLLLDDPVLSRLNLGVKVTRGVAVLWGPVPSPELSRRAEQRVRAMFELIDVRNRLTIDTEYRPLPNLAPAPDMPKFLPDALPPVLPEPLRRPVFLPGNQVELATREPHATTLTARSSPITRTDSSVVRLPFLGSIVLPR